MNRIQIICLCLVIVAVTPLAYFYSQRPKTSTASIQSTEPSITLRGKLRLKLFPGPPEYGSIEEGDEADYVWIVELDEPSFLIALNAPENELSLDLADIVKRKDAHDLILCLDGNLERTCEEYKDQDVIVRGILFHAHTAHHYTPLLIDLEKIVQQYPASNPGN
jgi:hypothetical protein